MSTEVEVGLANGIDAGSVISCDNIVTIPAEPLIKHVGYLLPTQESSLAAAVIAAACGGTASAAPSEDDTTTAPSTQGGVTTAPPNTQGGVTTAPPNTQGGVTTAPAAPWVPVPS